jgi:DNA polymerase I-like protein with 3'-5' exonuclease and polymerase domains
VLIAADYSQIELRVLAHLSGDPALIDAFRLDQDIHRRTAAEVFGVLPVDRHRRHAPCRQGHQLWDPVRDGPAAALRTS